MAQTRREALRTQQLAQARAARRRRMVGLGAALVAVLIVAVLIVTALSSGSGSPGGYPPRVNDARNGVLLAKATPKPGAPTIEVYVDFQCPYCRAAEERYGALLAELAASGDIIVVQRTVTFLEGPDKLNNTASTRAAVAATCADDHGRYAQMTSAIFAHQAAKEVVGSVGYDDELLRATLPAQVGITGADLAAYQACYDTKAAKAFLDNVAKAFYNSGVHGTPAFVRNGVTLKVQPVDDPAHNITATSAEAFKTMVLTGA